MHDQQAQFILHDTPPSTMRNLLLKCAIAAVLLAAALLLSPPFAGTSYATYGGCSATCRNGSCTADPEPGESCTCNCSWFTGSASCTCTHQLQPAPEPKPGT
jgi:hypothetical protein